MRMLLGLVLVAATSATDDDEKTQAIKDQAIASVDEQREPLVALSEQVWTFAEIALEETQSASVLADHAEQQGFEVARGVAGMPTAFVASFGAGEPVIGILGEYDALPRLSQRVVAERQARVEGGAGHGCGHILFGAASLGAAIAIKQRIEAGELRGTIRYFGTPAEEAIGGKVYMAREGLFDDVDVMLSWHPHDETTIDMAGSQAMIETIVEFRGVASHAASDPWNGRSALDGLELFTHSINLLREHVRPTVRIHYTIIDGGGAPNVVPETASVGVWIRDNEMPSVMELFERMKTMADGAAMAAEVTAEVTLTSGNYNLLQNRELATLIHGNMVYVGDVAFDEADEELAKALQSSMDVAAAGLDGAVKPLDLDKSDVEGGSTDVGDVSWIVPTVDAYIATAPVDIPWHSWGVVAASGSSIGQKGLLYAAKVLAATAVDLFRSEEAVQRIQAEFAESSSKLDYRAYIPDGPPPLPAAGMEEAK